MANYDWSLCAVDDAGSTCTQLNLTVLVPEHHLFQDPVLYLTRWSLSYGVYSVQLKVSRLAAAKILSNLNL